MGPSRPFYGREQELALLRDLYRQPHSQLAVLYGRRRVGKSSLIKEFARGLPTLEFEGLEKETSRVQIKSVSDRLKRQLPQNHLLQSARFTTWEGFFEFISQYLKSGMPSHPKAGERGNKLVLILDELPWMAAGKNRLVSLIKYYWDNEWKHHNLFLILCGSISSYMVKKVIRSKALYGRIHLELRVSKMGLTDVNSFLGGRRSALEVLKYAMILGGVPRYLEEIRPALSFEQNIKRLFFSESAPFLEEVDRIFYSNFKETQVYDRIVNLLLQRPMTLKQVSEQLKMTSGGGLKTYLTNLEDAEFIQSQVRFDKEGASKFKKYRVCDELTVFYKKMVFPHLKMIRLGQGEHLFKTILPRLDAFLGIAFENFCSNHALLLAEIMGFRSQVLSFGPLFDLTAGGFQVDLVFQRSDQVVTACEIKFVNRPIGGSIIREMEERLRHFPKTHRFSGTTLEKALIAPMGVEQAVRDSGYFHHIVTLEDFAIAGLGRKAARSS